MNWIAWHRPYRDNNTAHEPWVRVLVGEDERDVITALNSLRLEGDVMVLPDGRDPNTPRRLDTNTGRHHGTRGTAAEPPAVTRGRSAERAYGGKRQ